VGVGDGENVAVHDDVHAYPAHDNDGGIPSLAADQQTAQSVALVHYQLGCGQS
jgi:hypothetical protein